MAGAPIRRARKAAKAAAEEARRLAAEKRNQPRKAIAPVSDEWIDEMPPPAPRAPGPVGAIAALEEAHREAEILPTGRVLMEDGTLLEQEQFDTLVKLSFDRAKDIMEIKFDPKGEKAHQILTRQTTIISSVMTTLARIDEARLRRIHQSRYEKILEAIRKVKEMA